MDDIDTWRVAQVLHVLRGLSAYTEAAKYGDLLLEHGDVEGFKTWMRVARALNELDRLKPHPGEPIN